jgi:competence protein ComGC
VWLIPITPPDWPPRTAYETLEVILIRSVVFLYIIGGLGKKSNRAADVGRANVPKSVGIERRRKSRYPEGKKRRTGMDKQVSGGLVDISVICPTRGSIAPSGTNWWISS